MKKRISISAFIILLAFTIHAQEDTAFHLLKRIKGDVAAFAVDNLDNLYLLSSTNQLKKINANGDSVAIYNDVRKFGQASLIDVSNPLRVLLYYKDFTTIVILDRFLNVRNTIDLRRYNILQAKAVGQSYDNKIWVYDEVENKLKKIDEEGRLLLETPDFRQLFNPIPVPQRVFDQGQYVYLYDSTLAVYVFDYYGALKNKILISRWQNFKVAGRYIFGSDAKSLYRYDITTFRVDDWNMPAEIAAAKTFNFTASRLYVLRKEGIDIFSFH